MYKKSSFITDVHKKHSFIPGFWSFEFFNNLKELDSQEIYCSKELKKKLKYRKLKSLTGNLMKSIEL